MPITRILWNRQRRPRVHRATLHCPYGGTRTWKIVHNGYHITRYDRYGQSDR